MDTLYLIPTDSNIVKDHRSEIHVFSFYGDYVLGNHNAKYSTFEPSTNSLLVDVATTFKDAKINRGSYLIAINFFQSVLGNFDERSFFIREISPDRTELKVVIEKKYTDQIQSFKSYITSLKSSNILNNLVINFGFNLIQKVTNVRFDAKDESVIYLKLYQPIYDEIEIKERGWFDFEVIDPYIDTIILNVSVITGAVNYMSGPNFDIDTSIYSSNSTIFKNWNDLLDSDLTTSQQIIEQSLSGSNQVKLNIDYTSFENFIFYSSAEERVRNLHYKVSKIEEYSSSISILTSTTASNTFFVSSSVQLNQRRIDQITSTFTPFERWSYFEPTASIFSHDLSGSITPWPKRIINQRVVNYPISSSIVTNWYDQLLTSASYYDESNNNRLYWSIPEHIYMDEGNSDFVLFVDMVGEYFDELYAFIASMPQIHSKEEHPKRGVSNALLPTIAKSFGWNLQNTRATSNLWNYKNGTNSSGQIVNTGSLFDQTHESQTHQVWRRIVNNLPYLLKTKGTSRSVKALMSIYGIPQTLISIKEYGGPNKRGDLPTLIEDKFNYKLHLSGSQYVELIRRDVPVSSGSWGGVTRVPDTIEFRFNTEYSSSVSQSIWAIEDGSNRSRILHNLEVVHTFDKTGQQSYSGSYKYGFLRYTGTAKSGSSFISSSVSSSILTFFDDDIWTVRLQTPFHVTNSGSIDIKVGKVSDSIYGRIVHTSSFSYSTTNDLYSTWSTGSNSNHYVVLGGTTGSRSNRLVGNVQGYKEYFEILNGSNFDNHIRNPRAYNSNNETGSFYTLFRYYPLGLDEQRWDHSEYLNVSSSQPNRVASFDTTASFKNFPINQAADYDSYVETMYIETPSLGGNLLRSQKIRLEDDTLIRDLNPTNPSTKGSFDNAGFDSNKLAIVFAPNDHVNADIYNHTGFAELDDYIGDPEFEFGSSYDELKRFSHQYFQKYAQSNNTNALINILAFYDFTFFQQLKQLVPARADLIDGVLIENDILHRSKVQLTKRPVVTNPQWDTSLQYNISQSAFYQNLEASASAFHDLEMEYLYVTGSLNVEHDLEFEYVYKTGSISYQPVFDSSVVNYFGTGSEQLGTNIMAVPAPYSGSQSVTQSYIDGRRLNCCYKKVIYHYSSSGTFRTKYERDWYTAVSKSYGWHYSRSLECTSYQYQESCAVENRHRFGGTKISSPGINIPSDDTIDKGPVVTVWRTNSATITVNDNPLGGNLKVT